MTLPTAAAEPEPEPVKEDTSGDFAANGDGKMTSPTLPLPSLSPSL